MRPGAATDAAPSSPSTVAETPEKKQAEEKAQREKEAKEAEEKAQRAKKEAEEKKAKEAEDKKRKKERSPAEKELIDAQREADATKREYTLATQAMMQIERNILHLKEWASVSQWGGRRSQETVSLNGGSAFPIERQNSQGVAWPSPGLGWFMPWPVFFIFFSQDSPQCHMALVNPEAEGQHEGG